MNTSSLLSPEAVSGRVARKASYVVWVEMPDGRPVFELDADDRDHGRTLATVWCEKLGATSASVRIVRSSGLTRCVDVVTPERDWL